MERKEVSGASARGLNTQLIDILGMNNQELREYMKKLENENPLVELRGNVGPSLEPMTDIQRKLDWLASSDEQNRVYYQQEVEDEEDPEDWHLSVNPEESLPEFICAQLFPLCEKVKDKEILYYLANSLDSDGYLREDIEQLEKKFGISNSECYRYLYLIQSVDPAGIGARTLSECLLLQLDRQSSDPAIARRIILECLDLLSENRIAKIAIRLGISLDDAEENCRIIRRLNPKPGSCFSARENLRYLEPDVTVVRFQDYYQVMVNDMSYPRIHISNYYRKLMGNPELPADAAEYIKRQINQANWVKSSVECRAKYLAALMKLLIESQRGFFEKGPDYRKNMSLEELARKLELSVDELKALCRDKYVQCHWGIFPVIYLLARREAVLAEIPVSEEDDLAFRAKQAIRRILAQEDKTHPDSDQKITEHLMEMGIRISRRTVAKYRVQMGIREAGGRREWPEEKA